MVVKYGSADLVHPQEDFNAGELTEGRRLVITTRAYVKYPWSKVALVAEQCLDAVNLLERCGWRRGNYEEIWAFIWAGEVQIGYIWLMQEKVEPWVVEEGNVTAAAAAAAAGS